MDKPSQSTFPEWRVSCRTITTTQTTTVTTTAMPTTAATTAMLTTQTTLWISSRTRTKRRTLPAMLPTPTAKMQTMQITADNLLIGIKKRYSSQSIASFFLASTFKQMLHIIQVNDRRLRSSEWVSHETKLFANQRSAYSLFRPEQSSH